MSTGGSVSQLAGILHEGTYMSTDASTDPVIVATARSPIGRAFSVPMTEIGQTISAHK